MFKNYILVAWRGMMKQKMYSAIKVGGFAIGIAACLLIGLFIMDELSYDQQYPDKDRIYRVLGVIAMDGETRREVWMPPPFAETLKSDYEEVEETGRLNPVILFGAGENEVRRIDRQESFHEEHFTYADQSLLNLLRVPMVAGSREHALSRPNTIVISQSRAEKYFPGEEALGKVLILNNDETRQYTVGGVMEDFPANSHLKYDFFITMTGLEFYQGEQKSWGSSNYPTYVVLKEGVDPVAFANKMKAMIEVYWVPMLIEGGMANARELLSKVWFELQPVTDIHLYKAPVVDDLPHGDIRLVWLFAGITVFILLIASVNFINLSTAKSANRAREVGIRKVVGSHRNHLINQFLAESILYSLVSFLLALLLVQLSLPFFNHLAQKQIVFPWQQWWVIPALLLSAVGVGILAGLYPSVYLSSFRPVQVLKGSLARGSKTSMTRSVLVVFQFATSIILIICTFVISRQMDFILNKKLGFAKEQVVLLHGTKSLGNQVRTFRDELLAVSGVKNVSIGDYLPVRGTNRNGNTFWKEGRANQERGVGGQKWIVDDNYIGTLGMKLVAGRDFSRELESDNSAVIINQKMVHELGLTNPVGQRITNGDAPWTIIGVVEDFHFESMKEEIGPLCMLRGESNGMVAVKVETGGMAQHLRSITEVWKKISPNQTIRYSFLDEGYARMYEDVNRTRVIFVSFAGLGILVACLGLFALSSFMAEQRSKEIGIRVVLGASVKGIVRLLTQNFVVLVLISFVIAAPVAWWVMKQWLSDFAYRTNMGWELFVYSGLLAVIIALITVSFQALRVAMANPVNSLRSE